MMAVGVPLAASTWLLLTSAGEIRSEDRCSSIETGAAVAAELCESDTGVEKVEACLAADPTNELFTEW